MLRFIKSRLIRARKNKEWRRKNPNNSTVCVNQFDFNNVIVGDYTYGELTVLNFGKNEHLYIGFFCSIASGVVFSLNADHPTNRASTFPFKSKVLGMSMNEAGSKGDIIVDDDVWIGQNAIILSGVHIGQGSVIAAGAVVTKDVPPYAIVGGVPAKIIKYRFSPDVIDVLLTIDYSKLTSILIQQHVDDLYSSLDSLNVEEVQNRIKWMPKKNDTNK